jgi:diacylglycerol kinase (ATP)
MWEPIREAIKSSFKEFKYIFTERPKQATEIARDLLHQGFDFIIGVGGDGTLNEIANGFFKSRTNEIINEDASLGIIPSGTGSDFIRFIKIPRDFRKSIECLKNAPKRKIDIGVITSIGEGRNLSQQYFINVADFGLGAEVVKRVSAVPSQKRGTFLYYRGFISTLLKYHSKWFRIVHAQISDGYFDLVLIEDMRKPEVIWSSHRLFTGTIDQHRKVHTFHVKKVKVIPEETVSIEYDGEPGGILPAEFEILEQVLNFRFQ